MKKIAKRVEKAEPDTESIDNMIENYAYLRKQRGELDDQMRDISNELVVQLRRHEIKNRKTSSGYKVTLVERANTTLNENTLRKRLGAQMWNKVTTRVLDKRKLDAFIKSGEVSSADVAMSMVESEPTHYIKVT